VAQQLSGNWFVDWANQTTAICFDPGGRPFFYLRDAFYRMTAVNGQLDVTTTDGTILARGVPIGNDGTISFRYQTGSGDVCLGVESQYVFDFVFTLHTNGTGSGSANWTYGANTFCFVCDKSDTAVLTRQF
jgi:hypothetical protein